MLALMPGYASIAFIAAARWRLLALALAALLAMPGCYYVQAARGQLEILAAREPIDEVIDDPATDPALAARLQLLRDARAFATGELGLPDNGSYRAYADLGRDYVLWNVIAAPEFSLQPKTWCYLVVGCLAYRGYFDEEAAIRYGARLADDGYDVFTGGVAAYSTLGRFEDPILNTMLARDDADLVALLFHELAHQVIYIADDTAFNESFASAVAEIGLEEWFASRGESERARDWLARQATLEERVALIAAARELLAALYASDVGEVEKRRRKGRILSTLEERLGYTGDAAIDINNAWLASVAMYRGYLPAFRALFANCGERWDCFYAEVEKLAGLEAAERDAALERLAPAAAGDIVSPPAARESAPAARP